jgi:hypothetical protein
MIIHKVNYNIVMNGLPGAGIYSHHAEFLLTWKFRRLQISLARLLTQHGIERVF